MPLPVEGLSRDSSEQEVRAAISDSISQLVDEGRTQSQAIAIATRIAQEKTGRSTRRGKVRDRRQIGILERRPGAPAMEETMAREVG